MALGVGHFKSKIDYTVWNCGTILLSYDIGAIWPQANRQQPCLQCVDVVDCRRVRSESRSRLYVTVSLPSHVSLSVRPPFFWHVLQLPCPVRKRFSNDHWRRERWKLGSQTVGSFIGEELITLVDCQCSRLTHPAQQGTSVVMRGDDVFWQEGEKRTVSNVVVDTDLYNDEASAEEESPKPAKSDSRSVFRKRASQRRPRRSSVSSSLVSSEDDEELSDVERRHGKRREVERVVSDGYDDDDENWSYARRSCRRRKQINYKFEEFDQLICGAIEDDVKEVDPTRECHVSALCIYMWLGSVVVRALDLLLEIAGSIPAAALSSATLDKLFTHIVQRQRLWSYDLMALYKSV